MMWMCLLLLAVVRHGDCVKPNGDVPDCGGLKCPRFKLLSRNDDYDVREYPTLRLVRTKFLTTASPNSEAFWSARWEAIERIRGYFRGENENNQTFLSAIPLGSAVCNATGNPCNEHYAAIYLPKSDPSPQPSNPELEFFTSPSGIYFVRGFRGAWEDRIKDHRDNLKALVNALKRDGERWGETYHFYATYVPLTADGYEEVGLFKM